MIGEEDGTLVGDPVGDDVTGLDVTGWDVTGEDGGLVLGAWVGVLEGSGDPLLPAGPHVSACAPYKSYKNEHMAVDKESATKSRMVELKRMQRGNSACTVLNKSPAAFCQSRYS